MPIASHIDRLKLVNRHNIRVHKPDAFSSLSLGNGRFACTLDVTGLQTFADFYDQGIPVSTQAGWAWHEFPNTEKFTLDDVTQMYDSFGRKVPYYDGGRKTPDTRAGRAYEYLRCNPHRIDLGRLILSLKHADGSAVKIDDLKAIDQTLHLWRGVLESRFELDSIPVRVLTVVHPDTDLIAVRVESELVAQNRAGIEIRFPAPLAGWNKNADFLNDEIHQTIRTHRTGGTEFLRIIDDTRYFAHARWPSKEVIVDQSRHSFLLRSRTNICEMVIAFSPDEIRDELPSFDQTVAAAEKYWKDFWSTGGAIDFTGSTDPRAAELERRVILSQYLTAINCASDSPPQETGLTCNSWYGKFHLEMHWWHTAHFALWGRETFLERSLGWYQKTIGVAQDLARKQGYAGARWGKMTSPDARESPSPIAPFLIWQQPHPIFLSELVYQREHERDVLERYANIVEQSALFMASFAHSENGRFVLGPPLIPAQESYGNTRSTVRNPTYELCYWHWGLKTANAWRERLGQARNAQWDEVADNLAPLPVRDGIYTAIETAPFTLYNDHPSHLMALGWLPPTPLVDAKTMSATLDDVLAKWDWPSTWGWDYPVVAMCAARLGRSKEAVDALLMNTPKNGYAPNGHNPQRENLPLYLPGNGGLLYAVAMMARGWQESAQHNAPGFPADTWRVRHEDLMPAI